MMIPTTMSRQDSGKMWCSFGVMWKPANIKRVNSFCPEQFRVSRRRRRHNYLELVNWPWSKNKVFQYFVQNFNFIES